jgi:hypothetical protein
MVLPGNRQGSRLVMRSSIVRRILFFVVSTLVFVSCTRSSVPLDRIETKVASITPQMTVEATENPSPPPQSGLFAIVWVNADEPLIARNPAGLSGAAVGQLAYDQRGLELTGASTGLGSSVWVEIRLPSGGMGWVNSWYLTEDVFSAGFCDDTRVLQAIDVVGQAVQERSGQKLAEISNPARGLILRHNWWNPEIVVPLNSLSNIYQDLTEIDWGVQGGSEFPIQGSFQDIIVPQLEDVFARSPEIGCNELRVGDTTREIVWPDEYVNINFYSVYRPVPEGGSEFDWRTWVLGFEYIDAQPYLTLLVQYRGEI